MAWMIAMRANQMDPTCSAASRICLQAFCHSREFRSASGSSLTYAMTWRRVVAITLFGRWIGSANCESHDITQLPLRNPHAQGLWKRLMNGLDCRRTPMILREVATTPGSDGH